MKKSIKKRSVSQIQSLRRQFAQHSGLPFGEVLSQPMLQETMDCSPDTRNRIFPMSVTLSAFLYQVLSPDHSCRDAVAHVLVQRLCNGQPPCSSATSAYCKARQRLSTDGIFTLVRQTGSALERQSDPSWKWKGRSVKLVDGTTVSMPDTPENQLAYPQHPGQEAGVGFPIARLVALISLSCGSLLDVAVSAYQGKQTGEHSLLRQLLPSLCAGDLLVGDQYFCSYFLIAQLQALGIDILCPLHSSRLVDFRRGKSLANQDHLLHWAKPNTRPEWMDKKTYRQMPKTLQMRQFKFGSKVFATTLTDPSLASKKELGQLFYERWNVEVDLRTIKETMQMDVLRCQTPEMVRKEIATHLLAYNLIRTLIAQAAKKAGKKPRKISPKGTIQFLNAFQSCFLWMPRSQWPLLYDALWEAIAQQNVGNRPGRVEPRVKKRKQKKYKYMNEPRDKLREKLLKNKQVA